MMESTDESLRDNPMSSRVRLASVTENPQSAMRTPGKIAERLKRHFPPNPILMVCCVAVLTMAGCIGIYREIVQLWMIWTGDPLRSIGMLIPPVSIVLFLRLWRQLGWELRGTWWGLLVILFSFLLSFVRLETVLAAVVGRAMFSVIPISLPVYLYFSGVVLMFAGARVWRLAWFPIGLLLLSQPLPGLRTQLIDIPLQNISAHVARSFATLIGFSPTTPQLRLMFSPDFGMFIAPGCDGIRGAVALGYVALILGYLKRVSWYCWIAYVAGGAFLGYLFNFVRLCALVLYYRLALGHPTLEGMAKQADYVIGSCLFLVATFLFLLLARRNQQGGPPAKVALDSGGSFHGIGNIYFKFVTFAIVLLVVVSLPSSAMKFNRRTTLTPESLASRMPTQVGDFVLIRTWYEQQGGTIVAEDGAYSAPGSGEIILSVWVAPLVHYHDANDCWLARGLQPELLSTRSFVAQGNGPFAFKTGFYSDGITDSLVVTSACTPGSCAEFAHIASNDLIGLLFLKPQMAGFSGSGEHPVSTLIRIDKLHSNEPKTVTHDLLLAEAQEFIEGLNPTSLSRAFQ
jgi:exosortase J